MTEKGKEPALEGFNSPANVDGSNIASPTSLQQRPPTGESGEASAPRMTSVTPNRLDFDDIPQNLCPLMNKIKPLLPPQKKELLEIFRTKTQSSDNWIFELCLDDYKKLDTEEQSLIAKILRKDILKSDSLPRANKDPINVSHLTGHHRFADMRPQDGISRLAREHPRAFEQVLDWLKEYAPDAFEAVPPEARSDDLRQLIMAGRCQSGKTRATLALAWLYYHFCGCYSYLFAWRFLSSVEAFNSAIEDFNTRLAMIEIVRPCLKEAKLHVFSNLKLKRNKFPSEDAATIICSLAGAQKIRGQLTDYLPTLLDTGDNLALTKELGRIPVVMLMDEDDENTQSLSGPSDMAKKENQLFGVAVLSGVDNYCTRKALDYLTAPTGLPGNSEHKGISLVNAVYHYVGISATHNATVIKSELESQKCKRQVVRMKVPQDYHGFGLPEADRAREIEVEVVPGDAIKIDADFLINDGMKRLKKKADIQRGGQAVVQLFIPKDNKVAHQEELAKHITKTAADKCRLPLYENERLETKEVSGKTKTVIKYDYYPSIPNLPILVSTLHGKYRKEMYGNKLHIRNISLEEVMEAIEGNESLAAKFLPIFEKHINRESAPAGNPAARSENGGDDDFLDDNRSISDCSGDDKNADPDFFEGDIISLSDDEDYDDELDDLHEEREALEDDFDGHYEEREVQEVEVNGIAAAADDDEEEEEEEVHIGTSEPMLLPGTKVLATDLMDLFMCVLTHLQNKMGDNFKGIYCGIVAQSRAGRAVTFKDSGHCLHLTDMLLRKDSSQHDNFIQAAHRIAGRYPGYGEAPFLKPNIKLWAGQDVLDNLENAIQLHETFIQMMGRGDRITGQDIVIPSAVARDRFKLTKPRVQKGIVVDQNEPFKCRLTTIGYEELASMDESDILRTANRILEGQGQVDLLDAIANTRSQQLTVACRLVVKTLNDNELTTLKRDWDMRPSKQGKQMVAELVGTTGNKIFKINTPTTLKNRAANRPRERGLAVDVCWWLVGNKMVALVNGEIVEQQAVLNGEYNGGATRHHEGVVPLLYFYPLIANGKSVPGTQMVLAVDVPQGVELYAQNTVRFHVNQQVKKDLHSGSKRKHGM